MLFLVAAIILVTVLFCIGFATSRRSTTVDDYVLAGQRVGLFASTSALVATWYGAESLNTLSDEVARIGLAAMWIDPIGISLCLVLVGTVIVPLLYRRNVSTVGDLFRKAGGPKAEWLCTVIVVPSYFGWIAAQLLAMGKMFEFFIGGNTNEWVCLISVVAFLLCVFGGNESLTWINTALLFVIIGGLSCLLGSLLLSNVFFHPETGQFSSAIPETHWRLIDPASKSPRLDVLGSLAVGCIGNIPAIELVQRVRSAKNEKTARWSCTIAAVIYLLLGMVPVVCGMAYVAQGLSLDQEPQVIGAMARLHLPLLGQLALFLAVIATILSTLTSAAASPASMLGLNFVEPMWRRMSDKPLSETKRMRIQQVSLFVMLVCGTMLAMSGETAFQLVRDSYGLLLAAIVVPFLGILLFDDRTPVWAIHFTMIMGGILWVLHWWNGWDSIGGESLSQWIAIPHELGSCLICTTIFGVAILKPDRSKAR